MEESQVTVSTKTFDPIKYEINWGKVKTVQDIKDILSSLEIMFTIPAEVAPPKQKLLHEKGLLKVKE
jgi:hypothetical protein